MSNIVKEGEEEHGLGGLLRTAVMHKAGKKIGFIGIGERGWVETFKSLEVPVQYLKYKKTAAELTRKLREEQGCDLVIALCHMREHHDVKLAAQVPGIDLVLGGHDHFYKAQVEPMSGIAVVKSGTDFKEMSAIKMYFGVSQHEAAIAKIKLEGKSGVVTSYVPATKIFTQVEHVQVKSKDHEPDAVMMEHCGMLAAEFGAGMDKVIGYTAIDMEARTEYSRMQETNLGYFFAELLRTEFKADFAIIGGGTFRLDEVVPEGPLTLGWVHGMLPFPDESCSIKLKGSTFIEALENAVSQYPVLEGRFPQVAGFKFSFDASKPKGSRVLKDSITLDSGAPFKEDDYYSLATVSYWADGGDDFKMLVKDGEVI